MFFGQEYIVFEILDVLGIDMSGSKAFNSGRNYEALSFRTEAEAVLSASGRDIELSGNSVCYVPSNVNYNRVSVRDKLIVVHFKSFNYHSNEIECFYPENHGKYRELFEEMLNCWNERSPGYKNLCAGIFSKIMYLLYIDNKRESTNSKIQKSLEYIEQNCFSKDFSIERAATKSFMSEAYFRKLFKKETGVSPKRYVINRRIEYAKALIIAGYFSVSEVAEMCGYNDQKHFSAEFKRFAGVSPQGYRYNF